MSYGNKCTAWSRIRVSDPDAHRPRRTAANCTGDDICGNGVVNQRKGGQHGDPAFRSPAGAAGGALNGVVEAVGGAALVALRKQLDVALGRGERHGRGSP